MFESAYKIASKWTFPIIQSTRLRDGRVATSLGTGFLVNNQGYFLTASHVVHGYTQGLTQIKNDANREAKAESIRESDLPKNEIAKQLRALGKPSKDDPINVSLLMLAPGNLGRQVEALTGSVYEDIACGKIANFSEDDGQIYPTFVKLPGNHLPSGKSLCTLGHAFHKFSTIWDDNAKEFKLSPGALPVPRFPMDSILTRGLTVLIEDKSDNSTHQSKFIELSSPGLKGQSGGPVFDVNANVYGIQSQTECHELGFNTREKQYFNTGIAVHPNSICDLLKSNNITYNRLSIP